MTLLPSPRAMRLLMIHIALCTMVWLSACRTTSTTQALPWNAARQLVLVTTQDWSASTGQLRRFERDGADGWRIVGNAIPVTIGKNGSAWGTGLHPKQSDQPQKREGDGRAPAGVFAIGTAFGYVRSARTSLPYAAMSADDWCIDVPASPLYNRIVDSNVVGAAAIEGSSEPMRRDLHADGDQRYKLGFVIEHNPSRNAGGGSCIFAHLWKAPGQTTAGCTAMDEPAMHDVLAWLRPQMRPIFVLLPRAELARLADAWKLPAHASTP